MVLTGDNATLAAVSGMLRRQANFTKGNSRSYSRGAKLQPEAFASPAGCAAEIAVAQHLGMSWDARAWLASQHNQFSRMPDVGENIEVKRIRDNKKFVEVKAKETGRGRILWVVRTVGEEHLELDLLGWMTYDDAWAAGEPTVRNGVKDPDSHTLTLDKLTRCTCLTGMSKHAPEPPIELGGMFQVPTQPLNGAGQGNPACISNQSAAATRALFDAVNTGNPVFFQGLSARSA